MHILVFGTGGVGGYFGGRLALAGERITFIARGEHLQAMLSHGLHVDSIKGNFNIQPVRVTDDLGTVKNVDAILLCVKAWHIPEAAQAIRPILGKDTFIVPLENSVEAPSQVAEIVGKEHVFGGLCRITSRISSPGHIQHTGIEPSVEFGELDNQRTPRAQSLLGCFVRAGVKAEISANIQAAMWDKFLFISAVSGMGAITRVPFGQFRSIPETRRLLETALAECFAVARAQGIHLPENSVAKTLAFIDSLPPGTMASMQRDILEGRPSELEAQNGAVVRMGHAFNIPTPTHNFIYSSLLPQERLARGQVS